MATHESAKDRRRLAREAGYGTTSLPSILAGTLVAFGALGLALAVAGAVGSRYGLRTDGISTAEWRRAGIAGAAVATAAVFLAFLFGGYTAGRMGRRAGARHGLLVFVLGAVLVGVVVGLAAWLGDTSTLRDSLTSNGVPVDANTWSDIGIGAAIAGVVAMLVGAVLGGIRGDRWHGRLVTAADEARRDEVASRPQPARRLGEDATTSVDVRDRPEAMADDELSLEEERERARH
jgi:MFS family permease